MAKTTTAKNCTNSPLSGTYHKQEQKKHEYKLEQQLTTIIYNQQTSYPGLLIQVNLKLTNVAHI